MEKSAHVIRRGEAPPIIQVVGPSMPEAWEKAYLALAEHGRIWRRDDATDFGDQIGARMTISITNPDLDPFTHLFGGTNALEAPLLDYDYEMLGAKPSSAWIKRIGDLTDNRWDYMYRERMAEHPAGDLPPIDQIAAIKEGLINNPASRRNNIITWYPERDLKTPHTPCLQRAWFEIIGETLDMQYEFRSRNVANASMGNIHGMYIVGCDIRDAVEEATGRKLELMLTDTSNSFHVNSGEFPMYKNLVKQIKKRRASGERRFLSREEVVDNLLLARDKVEADILAQTAKHYDGDMVAEAERVHKIGDRVFHLLNKYSPAA
jgi:thymidylate synthase